MLWLWSQPSCDQDKGQHTDLPQQHGSCISNHSHRAKMLQLYPMPDAFDHVHCFFSSIALKIGLRIPTYIISFIWDGFPYISYLLKQSGKKQTGLLINFHERRPQELQAPRRRSALLGLCFQNPELQTTKKPPPCS